MSFGDGPGYYFQCPNECLVTKLRTFSRTQYMSVLHTKFDVETVMNEEIPVNEWQKKIKMSKLAEMMFIL